jgi:serine/threonine protein kinase
LRLGLALARILAQVHQRGIVHKDLNPANILIGAGPLEVFLVDFDIASPLEYEQPTYTAVHGARTDRTQCAPDRPAHRLLAAAMIDIDYFKKYNDHYRTQTLPMTS